MGLPGIINNRLYSIFSNSSNLKKLAGEDCDDQEDSYPVTLDMFVETFRDIFSPTTDTKMKFVFKL